MHGHLDVVPADPAAWSVDPFAGEIRDGVLWGRGAVDMKNADAVSWRLSGTGHAPVAVHSATSSLPSPPTRRTRPPTAPDASSTTTRGCLRAAPRPIGESGGFTFHAKPGLRLYPIGVGGAGNGLAEADRQRHRRTRFKPRHDNAVIRLAEAITRIAAHQWPVRLIATVRAAMVAIAETVGADLGDLDLDHLMRPIICPASGPGCPAGGGTLRNSANPTMLQAGYKVNVIPGEAVGFVDGRVLPGYEAEFRATIDELTGPDVTWEYAHRERAGGRPARQPARDRHGRRAARRGPERHWSCRTA